MIQTSQMWMNYRMSPTFHENLHFPMSRMSPRPQKYQMIPNSHLIQKCLKFRILMCHSNLPSHLSRYYRKCRSCHYLHLNQTFLMFRFRLRTFRKCRLSRYLQTFLTCHEYRKNPNYPKCHLNLSCLNFHSSLMSQLNHLSHLFQMSRSIRYFHSILMFHACQYFQTCPQTPLSLMFQRCYLTHSNHSFRGSPPNLKIHLNLMFLRFPPFQKNPMYHEFQSIQKFLM
jgi:hypothetical protein